MPLPDALFKSAKPVMAMIRLGALPGTPASAQTLKAIKAQAVSEVKIFREAGVHGLMIAGHERRPAMSGMEINAG